MLTDDQETHPEGVVEYSIFSAVNTHFCIKYDVFIHQVVFFPFSNRKHFVSTLSRPTPQKHALLPPTRLFLRFSPLSQEVWPQLSMLCCSTCHSACKPQASDVSDQSGGLFHFFTRQLSVWVRMSAVISGEKSPKKCCCFFFLHLLNLICTLDDVVNI